MNWTIVGYGRIESENINGKGFDVWPERMILIDALEEWISMLPVNLWSREFKHNRFFDVWKYWR